MSEELKVREVGLSSIERAFTLLRALAEVQAKGARVTHLAKTAGFTQATTHRLLQSLVAEHAVEQIPNSKLYRLSLDFFALAAKAGNSMDLRSICRPSLLRLSGSLEDTVFLLVRSEFDAICLDRSEGLSPIRSFTGDVGGRVALGVGQGSLAILAYLPESEREEVIRHNLPRLREMGAWDEVDIRTEIENVRRLGYASRDSGLVEGMAGVGVPVLDSEGRAVAALSVGTISSRLNADRLPTVVELLKREAASIGPKINPFDVTLRRPRQSLSLNES